ncbi:MAG: hypothetical protein HRU14_09850 [Planctomycetes bacterium]|nr:hypothetical protein [Planctomycetota bacterium]
MSRTFIGKPIARKEDRRFIRGLGKYVDDVNFPNLHHCAILRSPFAHARINGYDLAAAKAMPGVVGVFTGEDTEWIGGVPRAATIPEIVESPKCPVLAEKKVRFVGEPVVAVVAKTLGLALDALEAVEVDWEQLDVVVDPEKALADGAPRIHDELSSNLAFDWKLDGGTLTWEEAKEKADRVSPSPS